MFHSRDPNGEREIWNPFKSDNFAYLHIKTETDNMEEKLRYKNYIFWKNLIFPLLKLNTPPKCRVSSGNKESHDGCDGFVPQVCHESSL